MGLVTSLLLVFFAFCLLMAGVLAFCIRERRKVDGIGNPAYADPITGEIHPNHYAESSTDAGDDERVAIILFGSIFAGALLALMTGYLVFFREW